MSSDSTVYGTNVAPISFPGIVSGIDYNEIIDKLTQLSLAPTTQLNAQIATLNNANTELIKISNLLASVQNALGNLSNPECTAVFSIIHAIPAGVLDSSSIGTAVIADSADFLTAHPNASAVYGLIGPVFVAYPSGAVGPRWVVEFSTCALTPDPTGDGAEYNATLNTTNGDLEYSQTLPSVSCITNPPAAIGLAPLRGLVSAIDRSGTPSAAP